MRMGCLAILLPTVALAATPAPEVEAQLARLRAVGREGAGNVEASKAWRALVQQGPAVLLPALAALDSADPTAANWLRAAIDAVAERELRAGRKLPAADLEAFIRDVRHSGPGRRLAYEWLLRADPGAAERLLPGMLQDPSAELRRDAVVVALKEAQALLDKGDKQAAVAAFRKILAGALDRDQVDQIAKQLKSLGADVDLASHFGFVRTWLLAGPFDNTEKAGFARSYPPEKGVDPTARYQGKGGAEVRWIEHTTTDPYGLVDLNKAIAKHMGAVAYAYTVVVAEKERPVEIRVGSNNAVKLFLNGKPIFAREEYHHGLRMDQHVGVGTLKAGRNEILVKVCQNEQKDEWAQSWSFQLRICDAIGAAVPVTVATTKPAARPTPGEER